MRVTGVEITFGALVLAQAAHSIEEYLGRLWDVFLPARLVSGLVSQDLQTGFVVLNMSLVAFGVWCLAWPVHRRWENAAAFMWIWVGVESANGVGHILWALSQGRYAPGVMTAPFLLGLALYLGTQLRSANQPPHRNQCM